MAPSPTRGNFSAPFSGLPIQWLGRARSYCMLRLQQIWQFGMDPNGDAVQGWVVVVGRARGNPGVGHAVMGSTPQGSAGPMSEKGG
jgi:hypothetical protein